MEGASHSISTQESSQIQAPNIVPMSQIDHDLENGLGPGMHANGLVDGNKEEDHIRFNEDQPHFISPRHQPTKIFTGAGVGASDLTRHPRNASRSIRPSTAASSGSLNRPHTSGLEKYIHTVDGLVGRNSQFHNLTQAERDELGGLEYQAVSLLGIVVPLYFILWQLLGALGCGAWIAINRPSTARENGLSPFWTGAFFAVSAFNNSGMALLDANMTAFQTSYYLLLTLSLLILAGNTCFPPFLRLILWTMKTCLPGTPRWSEKKKVLQFILEHPRRVYTHLFPSQETWYLVGSLIVLNGIDWFA